VGFAADFARKAGAVFAVCAVMASAQAQAACVDPFHIASAPGVSAFTQMRHLKGMKAPLVSRGTTSATPAKIEWHVKTPVDVLTTITGTGITQSVEGGPTQTIASGGGSDPFLTNSGLFEVLTGDFTKARAHYETVVAPRGAADPWALKFTPKEAGLARFVATINVRGCTQVEAVDVHQANGDWMEIKLAPAASPS
jgi:hypothetical protein